MRDLIARMINLGRGRMLLSARRAHEKPKNPGVSRIELLSSERVYDDDVIDVEFAGPTETAP